MPTSEIWIWSMWAGLAFVAILLKRRIRIGFGPLKLVIADPEKSAADTKSAAKASRGNH